MSIKDLARTVLSFNIWAVLQHANAAKIHMARTSHRERLIRDYMARHKTRKLQVGAGDILLEGWLNTDLIPTPEIAWVDVREPLPLPDQSFDYIFSEHVIEHVSYADGAQFIRDCFRVIKPGGRLRLATPNLGFITGLHHDPATPESDTYIRWTTDRYLPDAPKTAPGFVVNNMFYNWGHRFVYDAETLAASLESAGFQEIRQFCAGESDDPVLRGLESHGRHVGEEINRLESLVIEGSRR